MWDLNVSVPGHCLSFLLFILIYGTPVLPFGVNYFLVVTS